MTVSVGVEDIRSRRNVRVPAEGREPEPPVHYRHQERSPLTDAFQPVLSTRARVDGRDVPSFISDALRGIRTYIEEHHVDVLGPPFSICRPAPKGAVDVEVGWPVHRSPGTGAIVGRDFPTGLIRVGRDHP